MVEEQALTCRYCERPIAVPASACPWCRKQIMVICASCRQYTDDQGPVCQRCGAPLEADTMEGVRSVVGLDESIAQLVADRGRAQLLASAVIAQYVAGFFFDDGHRRTILVDLFGTPRNRHREAAAVLFGAVASLLHKGYCKLDPLENPNPVSGERSLAWGEVRSWDGQLQSLEGALAQRAGVRHAVRDVIDQVVAQEMDFRFDVTKPPLVPVPGVSRSATVVDLSSRSATTAVIELGRRTELPEHQEATACRETYGLVLAFVQADPDRARYIADQIEDVLRWFEQYEADPSLGLMR